MKIIRFLGGLGNQMFQYAFYKSLQLQFKNVEVDLEEYHDYPLHNGFELEKIFNIHVKKANKYKVKLLDPEYASSLYKYLRKLLNLKDTYYHQRNAFYFDSEIYKSNKPMLYWGYWQNVNFLTSIEEIIRDDFQFKLPLNHSNQLHLHDIKEKNSIAVHLRLGDYVTDPLLGGICDISYYQKAVSYIRSAVDNPIFFIFSDDMKWCRENLFIPNAIYISGNKETDSYIDMQLMSNCKHNIIANSTFSWWSAWLNPYKGKIVIAPNKWTNDPDIDTLDIIPASWIRL